IPLDAKHVAVTLPDQALGYGNGFVAGHGFNRGAGGDETEQRQLESASANSRRNDLDRPAAVPRPADEAFLLQVGEVLVDGGERRQVETAPDFLEARGVAVLLDELVEIVEDFTLAFGER